MEFQNHAERLAWRNNPGNGIALVGTAGNDHMVVCINPTQEQQDRWCRNGAEMHLLPEFDAAVIDGKPWYSEDGEPVVPLPATAKRARPWLTDKP